MDAEPVRIYHREWKKNKPHLPKSTSLPLLRLSPQDRAVFVCKLCGFSNLLVPMCLWCCWSSAEARRNFQTSARRTLRRAARSAPRLLKKPVTTSDKGLDVGPGRHQPSECHRKAPRRKWPHASTSTTVIQTSGSICPPRRAKQPPWISMSIRRNRGGEGVISEPRKAQTKRSQGRYPECGISDCGAGFGENNDGPTRAIERSRLQSYSYPRTGDANKTKGASGGSSRSASAALRCLNGSPVSRSPHPLLPSRFPTLAALAAILPFTRRGRRGGVATDFCCDIQPHKLNTTTPSSTLAMLLDTSGPATDTRSVTPNASCTSPLALPTTTHERPISHFAEPTENSNYVAMDVGVLTAIQFNQAPTSQTNQAEASTAPEQSLDSGIGITNDTTMMKTDKKRSPIPSILLHHDSSSTDTPIAHEGPTSDIPVTTETTPLAAMKNVPPPSPVRTLRRKKRLSLIGLSSASSNALAPPEPCLPFSPPPLQTSHSPPQFSPALSAVTPPDSFSHTFSAPEKFPPTIIISAPTPITPMMIEPSWPIPPPATTATPTQTLPRIGTPKRPYYSTVRANNMNNKSPSSISHLSTSTSPSFTFTSAADGGSRAHTSIGTPGSPDQSTSSMHLDAHDALRPASMLTDSSVAQDDSASATAETHRPVSTSAIVTVPPLPPVATSSMPIPIPVQMHMRPSSPVRSILSVLDPAHGDEEGDEDDEHGYNQLESRFGKMLRERRSSNLKEKRARDTGGGGYSFPLSLSLSLGRRRGRTPDTDGLKSGKEKNSIPMMPTLSSSRSYNGFGGFGVGRGCSMSGEVEMRMALAERSNANGGSDNSLQPAFKFQENKRPSYHVESLIRGKSSRKKLMKMRSSIELSSSSPMAPPPSSPSKPKIGTRLKEFSINFLGKFQGGDANRSL